MSIFDDRIIQDHNVEGYDSVDSYDFEPGFGCVVPRIQPVIALPELIDNRTEAQKIIDKDNRDYFFRTDTEKQKLDDEYLKTKGVI